MKSKMVLLLSLSFIYISSYGQNKFFSYNAPDSKDFLSIIELLDFKMYSIDIPEAKTVKYILVLHIDEYNKKELVKTESRNLDETIIKFTHEGKEQSIITDKIKFIFDKRDKSEMKLWYDIASHKALIRVNTDASKIYAFNQFKLQEMIPNKKIPVVLMGSTWQDVLEDGSLSPHSRFCMEIELDADLSNDAFGLMPHYFVVSIELKR